MAITEFSKKYHEKMFSGYEFKNGSGARQRKTSEKFE